MIHKISAVTLTVLIVISTFSAYGTVLSDCTDQPCCCAGMVMAGEMEAGQTHTDLNIESAEECCCGDVTGRHCSLSTMVPMEKIEWALSSTRIEPSYSAPSVIVSMVDVDNNPASISKAEVTSEKTHPGSPPIYLASMSFIC